MRQVVCTGETVLRRRETTSVEGRSTREQHSYPDITPEKHDEITQKPTYLPNTQPSSPPASPFHHIGLAGLARGKPHMRKSKFHCAKQACSPERGLGDMQSWYLAGEAGCWVRSTIRFMSFAGLDTACCACRGLVCMVELPVGGWVVGCDYWGQGLWYSGFLVGHCFSHGER